MEVENGPASPRHTQPFLGGQSPLSTPVNMHVSLIGDIPWQRLSHDEQAQMIRDSPLYRPQGPTPPGFSTPPLSPNTFVRSTPVPSAGPMSVASIAGTPQRSSPYAAAVRAEFYNDLGTSRRVTNSHVSFGGSRWVRGERVPVEEPTTP